MNYELTPTQDAIVSITEAVIAVAVTGTCKKGIECTLSYGAERLGMNNLQPKYNKAVTRTIKIAATVVGGRLAGAFAKDYAEVMKGAFYGYNIGRKMAENKNGRGGESEVLDGRSEEE